MSPVEENEVISSEGTAKVVSSTWCNEDNQRGFYCKKSIAEKILGYAELAGLATGCDVDCIFEHIKEAKSLLEIGGGYGRVVQRLLERQFSGSIDVVESSPVLGEELEKFGPKLQLHLTDIAQFQPGRQYAAILSLWSGISDFAKHEQLPLMQRLSDLLLDGGKLIMDTSLCHQKPIYTRLLDSQSYVVFQEGYVAHGYIPSQREMAWYASEVGLTEVSAFVYETESKRQRMMYIFQK